jgi:hypothetical protein
MVIVAPPSELSLFSLTLNISYVLKVSTFYLLPVSPDVWVSTSIFPLELMKLKQGRLLDLICASEKR